jgi:hypothetical protein
MPTSFWTAIDTLATDLDRSADQDLRRYPEQAATNAPRFSIITSRLGSTRFWEMHADESYHSDKVVKPLFA